MAIPAGFLAVCWSSALTVSGLLAAVAARSAVEAAIAARPGELVGAVDEAGLIELLDSDAASVQVEAAWALATVGSPSAVGALRRAETGANAVVRDAAGRAIGAIRDRHGLEVGGLSVAKEAAGALAVAANPGHLAVSPPTAPTGARAGGTRSERA